MINIDEFIYEQDPEQEQRENMSRKNKDYIANVTALIGCVLTVCTALVYITWKFADLDKRLSLAEQQIVEQQQQDNINQRLDKIYNVLHINY